MKKLTMVLVLVLAITAIAAPIAAAVGNDLNRPKKEVNCERYGPCGGSQRGETMFGRDDYDRINAQGGNDYVYGKNGPDVVRGGNGHDNIRGQDGGDFTLAGDAGNDDVYGGRGGDSIYGGPGSDFLTGDKDNDRIYSNDGRYDLVQCGPGRDRVQADHRDGIYGCEDVVRR